MQKTSNKLSNPLCLTLWSWLRFHLQFFLQQSGWLYSCKKSQQFQFPSETEANSAQKWVIFEAWWKPDVHDQRDAPHIVQPHPSPQAACFTTARCVTNCGRKDRRSQWLQKKKKKVFNVSPGFQNQRVVTELLYLGVYSTIPELS